MNPTKETARVTTEARGHSVQAYARIAGVLFVLSIVAGGFGEACVPSRLIVSGDATATAQNIKASDSLFRLGFAGYLKTFSPDQLNTLALLSLKMFAYGASLFTVFYGVAWVLRGYLIFRSGYLPRFLGVLMTLGGLGFIARNFALVLAPAYASRSLLLLMLPGGLSLMVWLLVKGVDVPKWEAKAGIAGVVTIEG